MIDTTAPKPASPTLPVTPAQTGFSDVAQQVATAPEASSAVKTASVDVPASPAANAPGQSLIRPASQIAPPALTRNDGTYAPSQSALVVNVPVGRMIADLGQEGVALAMSRLKLGAAAPKAQEAVEDVVGQIEKASGGNSSQYKALLDCLHVELNVANTADRSQDVLHIKFKTDELAKLPPRVRDSAIFALSATTARLSAGSGTDENAYQNALFVNEGYYASMSSLKSTTDIRLTISPGAEDWQPRAGAFHAFTKGIDLGGPGQKLSDRVDKAGLGRFDAKPETTLWASSRMFLDPKSERPNFQFLAGSEISLSFKNMPLDLGYLNNPVNLKAYAPGSQGYAMDGDTFGLVVNHKGGEAFLPMPELGTALTSIPSFEVPKLDRRLPHITADDMALELIGGDIDQAKIDALIDRARPFAGALETLETFGQGVGLLSSTIAGAKIGTSLTKGRDKYAPLIGAGLGLLAHLNGQSEAQRDAYDEGVLEAGFYRPEGARAVFDDIMSRAGEEIEAGELTRAQLDTFKPELDRLARSIERLMQASANPENLAKIDPVAVYAQWAKAAKTSDNPVERAFAQQLIDGRNDLENEPRLEPDRLSNRAYVPQDSIVGLNLGDRPSDIFSFIDKSLGDGSFLQAAPVQDRPELLSRVAGTLAEFHEPSIWSETPFERHARDPSYFPRSEAEIRQSLQALRLSSPKNYEAAIGRLADLLHPYQIDLDLPDLRREIDARNAAVIPIA